MIRPGLALLGAALGTTLALACAPTARFRDAPPVVAVDDMGTIAEPETHEYLTYTYFSDILLFGRIDRVLRLPTSQPAEDTNALDEVPDSSWFENRIGQRAMSPEEVARGPEKGGPPQLPFTITSGKSGGGNPGFIARDATGRSFLLKFDPKNDLEVQTVADIVTSRLLWAVGYHVPSDHALTVRRDQLILGKDAKNHDASGKKIPFTEKALDEILATAPEVPPPAGGVPAQGGELRVLVLASQLLDGKPKGGWVGRGRRGDDPNDRIDHERRRVLRGLRVFAAWLDHTDMKEDNSLDMYVTENGRQFLRHYLVDFGESLGGHASEKGRMEDGYEHIFDWGNQGKATLALGLWKRPWEDRQLSPYRGVGPLTTELFDPVTWHEAYPYWPFFETDAADAFWAARILAHLDRAHIEAVVAAAPLSAPGAHAYFVDALMARRQRVLRTFFEAVSPLDEFSIEQGALCATDLSARHRLVREGDIELVDDTGKVLDTRPIGPDARGCVRLPRDAYSVNRVRVRRGHQAHPVLEVHVRDQARVVGIVRTR
jgi:hypothetical protein